MRALPLSGGRADHPMDLQHAGRDVWRISARRQERRRRDHGAARQPISAYTLYAIGDVLLASYPEISVVSLAMHERPYRPVDLFHANVENADELFVAVEEPVGVVEVTLEREDT